ncbi:hypothetical protein Fot_11963 [Forsythia ovata]|uniref:Uncharacterized protein n=1 Tax=Forsythia ovata TaxID=205694 RepID=A0ABD1WNX1_9LAMI
MDQGVKFPASNFGDKWWDGILGHQREKEGIKKDEMIAGEGNDILENEPEKFNDHRDVNEVDPNVDDFWETLEISREDDVDILETNATHRPPKIVQNNKDEIPFTN